LPEFGINVENVALDWKRIVDRVQAIVAECREPKPDHLTSRGVHLVFGEAKFIDLHTVQANDEQIKANQIIIATGASLPQLPIKGIEHVVTHVELLEDRVLPEKIVIFGGGVVALEFAFLYARAGVDVSVVVMAGHRILRHYDESVREEVVEYGQKIGIKYYLHAVIEEIRKDSRYLAVEIRQDSQVSHLQANRILLAVGRVPNVAKLGLEKLGIEYDHGGIIVDEYLRTTVPHIWAVGDVRKGTFHLAQPAGFEARHAARMALTGNLHPINETIVPFLIGTTPAFAGVGLTEKQAQEAGLHYFVHFQKASEICPVAKVKGEPDGFLKMMFDADTGKILGAYAFHALAPALIQQIANAMLGGVTLKQLQNNIYIFPGYTQLLMYAVRPRPEDPV
jgi:pyruvate/2-oxoglutarate dehydrogenase complex dihydrolipoamide dehydrogenase (E3) component